MAPRQTITDVLHGHRVADPYRWLEDPTGTDTAGWLDAQDAHWRAHARRWPDREHWRAAVAAFSDTGMVTAPTWRGGRRFFLRQQPGQEHPVLHVAEPDGDENVLVDPMSVDPTGLTTLDAWAPDPDGRLLAYQLSHGGTEYARLHLLDIGSGRPVGEPGGTVDGCRYSPVAWLPGGDAFYYVRSGQGVYLHLVGIASEDDIPVLGTAEHPRSYGLEISADGRWLVVAATRTPAPGNDLWLADLTEAPRARPVLRPVQQDTDAATAAFVHGGRLYVLTDRDAPTRRLRVGDPHDPAGPLTDLVPADPGAVLADLAVLDGPRLERPLLLVTRVRHAIGELTVHDLATGEHLADVALPGAGSLGTLTTRTGGHEAWFTYTDSATPPTVHRYDGTTGRCTWWAGAPGAAPRRDTLRGHRLVCRSADGTAVRMVALAGPNPSGRPRPAILYGYGGFGQPLTPAYSAYALAWVRAGGVFATAQLRGGGEEGESWHRAGMLADKQHTFDDFLAAAEFLVATGWTTPAQLGVCGESNGGLTVGAALTQRPDLFAAAVCSAPLLDMVRYERFGTGARWRGEYGSAADPEQLGWLLGYSPYHRVRAGVDYPAVLLTVFGGDTRVDPVHASKMCAALQWASTGTGPVLLRREDAVGHGAAAASRAVDLAADMLTFLAAQTGLAAPGDPS